MKNFILKFFFFFFSLYCYLFSAQYQFKAIFKNSQQAEESSKYLLIFEEQDLFLEIRGDLFFDIASGKSLIDLPSGNYRYILEYENQKTSREIFLPQDNSTIEIDLKNFGGKKEILTEITKVRAKKKKQVIGGKISLTAKEARRVPGAGNDILRSVVALPGVQGTAGANGEIFIRGADKDDVYYTINNIKISNPFHVMGYLSVIPNIIYQQLNVYLGGFETKFMNTQGGIIEIVPKKIKDYDAKQINFEAEISMAAFSLNINFPIFDNLRINTGIRRSYLDFAINTALWILSSSTNEAYKNLKSIPFFFDANLFLDWEINKNNDLKVFTIFSDDGADTTLTKKFFSNITYAGQEAFLDSREGGKRDEKDLEILRNSGQLRLEASELWNVQAIEHSFNNNFIENTLSLYHRGITNYSKLNEKNYGNYSKDEFNLKSDFTLNLNSIFKFQLGGVLRYEFAQLVVFENKNGTKKPTLADFGLGHLVAVQEVFDNPFQLAIGKILYPGFNPDSSSYESDRKLIKAYALYLEPKEQTNYSNFKKALIQYNNDLEKKILAPKRWSYSGYASGNFSFAGFLLHTGINSTFNDFSKRTTFDPRFSLSYFLLQQVNLFFKAGKFSQLPELYVKKSFTFNANDELVIISDLFIQDKNLEVPFAYHINGGLKTTLFNLLTLNIEGYYKLLEKQIMKNPTYDSKYSAGENNPRSISEGNGSIYGLDIFIRQAIFNNSFGWISYSWTRSLRKEYKDKDYQFNENKNNGLDYKNLDFKIVPFFPIAEHVFQIIYSFDFAGFTIGIRSGIKSGTPYTPKIIHAEDTGIKDEFGDNITNYSLKDGELYSESMPSLFTLSFRIEKNISKFKIGSKVAKLNLYLDLLNFHSILNSFVDNPPVTRFSYSEQLHLDLVTNKNFFKDKVGEKVPERYLVADRIQADIPIFALGIEAIY